MPHMMAFMPHRDVIVALCVKFTKIVPHKIFCASPPGGQEATLSDTLTGTRTGPGKDRYLHQEMDQDQDQASVVYPVPARSRGFCNGPVPEFATFHNFSSFWQFVGLFFIFFWVKTQSWSRPSPKK